MESNLRELSLFTGGGGGLLASVLLGWRTIGAVEIDEWCCELVGQRRDEGHLGEWFPIWNMDIRDFNREVAPSYTGLVDVVSAGFPCQPFSVAGKQLGEDDPRNMWPATMECIRIIEPEYVWLENVPGLLAGHGYFGTILGDLAESGYDARWRVLSAAEVGAPHKRDRLWIVAHTRHAESPRRDEAPEGTEGAPRAQSPSRSSDVPNTPSNLRRASGDTGPEALTGGGDAVANTKSEQNRRIQQSELQSRPRAKGRWWEVEPDVGGIIDGLA